MACRCCTPGPNQHLQHALREYAEKPLPLDIGLAIIAALEPHDPEAEFIARAESHEAAVDRQQLRRAAHVARYGEDD